MHARVPLVVALAAFAVPLALAQGGHEHVSGGFDSGSLDPGASWAFRFDAPGRFGYHCDPHPVSMQANVTVVADQPARNVSVELQDFAIEPKEMTVGVGSVVTWTNTGMVAHTASQTVGEPAVGVAVTPVSHAGHASGKETPIPGVALVAMALVAAALARR